MSQVFFAFVLSCIPFALAVEVNDPYSCPSNTVSADYQPQTGTWVCVTKKESRLELTRDVFEEPKNDQDPCPQGTWWHRTHDSCAPIVCTTEQNGESYDLDRLCPPGHHPHLGGARDKPLICVEDYRPENEKTGGKNPQRGGCDLCIINKPGHTLETKGRRWKLHWRFKRPEKKQKSLSLFAKSEQHFGGRELRPPLSRKLACPKGAATAKREDGRYFCFGGKSPGQCPPGSENIPTNDAFQPYSCLPCLEGEESIRIDGFARCLRNPCPAGRLPVPEDGLVERYSCHPPLEKKGQFRWDAVLDPRRKTPSAVPRCPDGQGLMWKGKKFVCQVCSKGEEIVLGVIQRNGYPICGLKEAPPCPSGQVPVTEAGKVRCVPCPEGSVFSAGHGALFPRCVPEEGGRGKEEGKAAPGEQPKTVPLLR